MATIKVKGQDVKVGDDLWFFGEPHRVARIEPYTHPVVTRGEQWRIAYSDGPEGTGKAAWSMTLSYDHGLAANYEVTCLPGDDRQEIRRPADDYPSPFFGEGAALYERYVSEGAAAPWRDWIAALALGPGEMHQGGTGTTGQTARPGRPVEPGHWVLDTTASEAVFVARYGDNGKVLLRRLDGAWDWADPSGLLAVSEDEETAAALKLSVNVGLFIDAGTWLAQERARDATADTAPEGIPGPVRASFPLRVEAQRITPEGPGPSSPVRARTAGNSMRR